MFACLIEFIRCFLKRYCVAKIQISCVVISSYETASDRKVEVVYFFNKHWPIQLKTILHFACSREKSRDKIKAVGNYLESLFSSSDKLFQVHHPSGRYSAPVTVTIIIFLQGKSNFSPSDGSSFEHFFCRAGIDFAAFSL